MLCVPPPRSPSPPSFAPALPAARRQSPTSVVRLIIVSAHACMMKPSPSGARRRRLRHRVRVRASLRPAANAFFSAPSARRTGARGARCCEMRVCEDEGGSKRTSGCSHGRRPATTRAGGPGFRTQTGTLGAGGCGPARMPPPRAARTNPRTSTGVCSRVRASPFGAPAAPPALVPLR